RRIPPRMRDRLGPYYHRLRNLPRRLLHVRPVLALLRPAKTEAAPSAACAKEIAELNRAAAPVRVALEFAPTANARLAGLGVYLRTDFWGKINSGGSYGHTCYVAKELAASTEQFGAFMAHRYTMLDEMGVRQVLLPPPGERGDENSILSARSPY